MIAEGYKDTEIGVIPIEWEVKQIKDFSVIATGNTPPTKDVDNYGIDYPWITPTDIGKKKDIYCGERSLSVQGYSKARQLPKDTVLITSIASIGKNAILREQGACNQQINAILPSSNHISEYVYYWFENNINTVIGLAAQTAVIMINKTDFSKIKIPLPPLKEQEKIADILSTADDKIDAIQKQIDRAETLKKGLLQKLLNEGIEHSKFKDSELGKIPESWDIVELGSCIEGKGNYGIGAAAVNYDKNLPAYLRITDIDENGKFISSNKKCVDSPEASKYQLKDGDIVFARTGNTTGKTYLYNTDDGILIYAGFLIKFTPNKTLLDSYYLKLQTETERYWNWVKVTSMRTGQPGINSEEYSKLLIPLPPLEEQKQIAEILSTADEKLEVLRAKKEKYETLKRGLLQKLLSGEIRV